MTDYRYRAFLSYSSTDDKMSHRLLRALETYRTPRRLVGSQGTWGEVLRRIYPVFRDREEFAASSDLGASIQKALRESQFLVVLCSRAAARSAWVNQEIKDFLALGREGRLLTVILDGEPGVSISGDQENECFPPALSAALGSGAVPLAADLRAGKDGWNLASVKLRAAILGVSLDELILRDRRRKRQRWAIGLTSGALLTAILGVGLHEIQTGRAEQRSQALIAEADEAYRDPQRWPIAAALYGRAITEAPARMRLDHLYAGFDVMARLRPVARVVEDVPNLSVFNWRGRSYVKWHRRAVQLSDQPMTVFKLVHDGTTLVVSDIRGLVRSYEVSTLSELWRMQLLSKDGACSIEDMGEAVRVGARWVEGGVTLSATHFQNVLVTHDSYKISSAHGQVFDADVVCGDAVGATGSDDQSRKVAVSKDVGKKVTDLPFPDILPEETRWATAPNGVGYSLRGEKRLGVLARLPLFNRWKGEMMSGWSDEEGVGALYDGSYTKGPERIDRCGNSTFTLGIVLWGMGGGEVAVCELSGASAPVCSVVGYGVDYLDGAISPRCDLIVLAGHDLVGGRGLIALTPEVLRSGAVAKFDASPTLPINRLLSPVFSPSGSSVAAIGGDAKIYVFRNRGGRLEFSGAHDAGKLGTLLELAYVGEDRLAVLSARDGRLRLAIVSEDLAEDLQLPIPESLLDRDTVVLSDGTTSMLTRERTERDRSVAEGGDGLGHGHLVAGWEVALDATPDGRFLALVTRSGAQLYAVEQGVPLGQPFPFDPYPAYGEDSEFVILEDENGRTSVSSPWSSRVKDHVAIAFSDGVLTLSIGELSFVRQMPGLDDAREILERLQERTGIDTSDGATLLGVLMHSTPTPN